MKILCVEDGSVDLDNLPSRKEWRDDKILVYKQGARPPFVLEISDESITKDIIKELTEIKLKYESLKETGTNYINAISIINYISDRLKIYSQEGRDD